MKIQWERVEIIDRKMPGQVTGGTQRHLRTVAVSRPWRGWEGSAAPGLPGREKDNATMRGCQIIDYHYEIGLLMGMCLLGQRIGRDIPVRLGLS